MITSYNPAGRQSNEEVVRMPQPSEALGSSLRDVFTIAALPLDLAGLIRKLDRCG